MVIYVIVYTFVDSANFSQKDMFCFFHLYKGRRIVACTDRDPEIGKIKKTKFSHKSISVLCYNENAKNS